jgi:23S rRNA-intervening sequence protein
VRPFTIVKRPPSSTAEGFGRYSPAQFLTFLDVSRASALETKSLLKKGLAVGCWKENEFTRLDGLATRATQSIAKLQRYLRSPHAKRNADRYRPQGLSESPKENQSTTNGSNENGSNANDPNANNPNANDPNDPNDPSV